MAAIYLDYNATTPLAPEVLNTVHETLRDAWGNPSSGHYAGIKARRCIAQARHFIARMINAHANDVIFTSGGTESNNIVLHSVSRHYSECSGVSNSNLPHIVISNLEHDSIDLAVREMVNRKEIEATVVKCGVGSGAIEPSAVVEALQPNTILVSIMLANNETGIIQPVREIAEAVREWERGTGRKNKIYVHTDAAQALGKIAVDSVELGVDYLTVVGHKFYGPRIGALFVKGIEEKATPLFPMLFGGGQERGFRPGTENTGMIAGLGKAAELVVQNISTYHERMKDVRDYLEAQLEECFGDKVKFNGRFSTNERIPNTSNVSLTGSNLQGNLVLAALERCQASVGAACHSHTVSKPSSILLACGIAEEVAINALRLSIGRETSRGDIDVFIADLTKAVNKLQFSA